MATVKLTSSDPLSAGVESNIGETALGKIQVVTPEDGRIIIDNPELLFLGDFERQGDDLTLSHGGETQLIIDYFGTGSPANIEVPNGAYLTAQAVTSLAGDPTAGRLAQSGGGGEPVEIGKVVKLDGSATSTSVSGVTNSLEVGAPVFQGDVIETGADSKLGISFLDETVFSMSADARMILDELIYDPADIENSSMAFNLVQGAFVFVTGEIAPSGNMNIETPVATMGIRGTTPKVTINTALGVTEFTILPDPGSNEVGNYLIINKATGDIMGSVASSADKWVVTGLSSEAVKINKSGIDLLEDQVALDEITDIFNTAQSQRAQLDGSNNFASVTVDLGLGEGLGDDGGSEADDLLDGGGEESEAAKDVNRPPVAGDDFFDADSSQIISGINLITGAGGGGVDIDPEGFPLGAIFVNDTIAVPASIMLPSEAILVIAANGGVSYNPNGKYDFLGRGDVDEDYFDYTIEDSGALTDTGRVTFTITGLNDQATITDPGTQLTLTEAADTGSNTPIASIVGSIAFNDTDASDRHTATTALFNIDWQQVNGGTAAVPVNPIGEIKAADLDLAEATVVDKPVMDRDRDTVNSVPDSVNGTVTWKWTGVESELDFLSALETVTLTYTIRVTDDSADNPFAGANAPNFVEQNVSLKITGINDAPSVTSAQQDKNLTENATTDSNVKSLAVSDTITFRDVDLNDIGHNVILPVDASAAGVVSGLPANAGDRETQLRGYLTFQAVSKNVGENTGSVVWNFDAIEKDFDYLSATETVTLTYVVTLNDGTVDSTNTQTITVKITGTNDAPIIAAIGDTGITETTDTSAITSAVTTVNFGDVDLSDTGHTASITAVSTSGVNAGLTGVTDATLIGFISNLGVTKAAGSNTGSVTPTFTAASTVFDYLADGLTVTLTYTIEVDDGDGGTDTENFNVVITGTNDAPIIAAIGDTGITETTDTSAITSAIPQINFGDVDLNDTGHTASITAVSTSGVVSGLTGVTDPTLIGFISNLGVTKADGSNTGSVTPTFAAASTVFDYLADTQTVTLTYTIEVDDGDGGKDTENFNVVITGTNDAPVIAAIGDTGINETTNTGAITSAVTTINFGDVDLNDTGHTASITAVSTSGVVSGLTGVTNPTLIGFISNLGVTKADGSNTGSVTPTFAAASTVFDYLADTQTVTLTYTIEVDDGDGGKDTEDFDVVITGTNDAPIIAAIGDTGITETTDTSAVTSAIPQINFGDVDLNDTGHTASITAVSTSGVVSGLTGVTDPTLIGFISNLGVTKVDGSNTGSVTPTFTAASTVFDYLADTQTVTLTYTIEVDDGDGGKDTENFNVVITGTNDAPVIAAIGDTGINETTNTGAITSAVTTINFGDVDLNDTGHTASITAVSTSGVVSGLTGVTNPTLIGFISNLGVTKADGSNTGSVTPTFAAASTVFDYLADTQTVTLTYTIEVDDGDGGKDTEDFDVVITGTNDAPIIAAIGDTGITETTDTSAVTSAIPQINFGDVDLNDTGHTASITAVSTSGVNSGLTGVTDATLIGFITNLGVTKADGNNTGSVTPTFTAASTVFDYLADAQTVTLTYTIEVDDGDGGTDTENFNVVITGTNDAPQLLVANSEQISNGDFQAPDIANVSFIKSGIDNWTVVGPEAGLFDPNDTTTLPQTAGTNQVGFINQRANTGDTPSALQQEIGLYANGADFKVSFDVLARAETTAMFQHGFSFEVDLLVDGNSIGLSQTLASPSTAGTTEHHDLTFTMPGTLPAGVTEGTSVVTLQFLNPQVDDTVFHSLFIDNVSVTNPLLLPSIAEDTTAPAGSTVGAIAGSYIVDIDGGAAEGIAVVGVDNTNGTWQYDKDANGTWVDFAAPSDASATLLADTAKIRFVPDADYNGSSGNITFRAWDQSSGSNGDLGVDVSTNGGNTAFSSTSITASQNITAVNDAPVIAFGPGAGDGIVTTALGTGNDSGRDVVVQSDGKILVAGPVDLAVGKGFGVARYNSDGSLDTTFGTNGIVVTDIVTSASSLGASGVALQADGKIIVAGNVAGLGTRDIAVARYTTSGDLDTTFGGGGTGFVTTDVGSNEFLSAVIVQPDGKILVAGSASGTGRDFLVARYDQDGILDTTGFASPTGFTITSGSGGNDYAWDVAIDSLGRVVTVGQYGDGATSDGGVMRQLADGSLDTSFGTGGIVAFGLVTVDRGQAVGIQSDDKIVAAGWRVGSSATEIQIARFSNVDGSLDTSFGTNGYINLGVGTTGDDRIIDVEILSDDSILAAGVSNGDFALYKFTANGAQDTSFGTNGVVTTSVGTDWGYGIAVQSDGKILLTGQTDSGSNQDFALIRYNADGSLDTSFDSPPSSFAYGSASVVVNSQFVLSDSDDTMIEGATVSIAANHIVGADYLDFTAANGINGVFNATTGVLTLNGSATLADYETVLESVTFQTFSTENHGSAMNSRTIEFVVNDGDGDSNSVSRTVDLTGTAPATIAQIDVTSTAVTNGDTGKTNYMFGNGDSNTINGQELSDFLSGGGGNDFLDGGLGVDFLFGDSGADTFKFSDNSVTPDIDEILDFEFGTDIIDFSSLTGAAGNVVEVTANRIDDGTANEVYAVTLGVDTGGSTKSIANVTFDNAVTDAEVAALITNVVT